MRRAAIVAAAVLAVALAAVSVVVVGIRTRYRPVLDRVRRFNRDVNNPRQLESAGTAGSPASIVRHTGRRSGRDYETPVTATWTGDGFVIGLAYGPETDWLKNVVAAGSATVVHDGSSYHCDQVRVVPFAEAAPDLPARERRALRLMGVEDCLRLRRAEPRN